MNSQQNDEFYPRWLVSFSRQIREFRKSHGMTQVELARRSETTQGLICQIENGHHVDMRISTVDRIARVMGLTLADVFRLRGTKRG